MLVLVGWLIAPAAAMPSLPSVADGIAEAALQTICHSGTADSPADKPVQDHGGHGDCLLCPACHLMAHVGLPAPGSAPVRQRSPSLIGVAAPLPPSTGPPSRTWQPAQPTGPPHIFA